MNEKIFKQGDLINPQNAYVLNQYEVNFYNKFTTEIKRCLYASSKEKLLNGRHKFLITCK